MVDGNYLAILRPMIVFQHENSILAVVKNKLDPTQIAMKHILITLLSILVFSGAANALNPSRTYQSLPEKFNMTYTATAVPTNDGEAILNSWYFPAKTKTTRLVLITHNGEGNMADYLRKVDGFLGTTNVVIFDYRGYGESSEFEIDNNMYIYPHFQDDVESMIDHCRKTYSATFDLYGFGIGAGLALGIGYTRAEITKIIADTPFLSMEDLEKRFSTWDEPMEVPFAGYEKKYEPSTTVTLAPGKNLKGVKLIIGSNDILYKEEDMTTLQKAASKIINKDIYVIENPDRIDNYMVDKVAYTEVLVKFLND